VCQQDDVLAGVGEGGDVRAQEGRVVVHAGRRDGAGEIDAGGDGGEVWDGEGDVGGDDVLELAVDGGEGEGAGGEEEGGG
jgi:hypothetical protein